jgi:hypothetical protein
MFMRFRGGGVGHKSTREATNSFMMDRDKLDLVAQGEEMEPGADIEPEKSQFKGPDHGEDDWVDAEEEDDFGYGRLTDDEEPDEEDEEDVDIEDVQLGAEDGEDNEDDTGFADL